MKRNNEITPNQLWEYFNNLGFNNPPTLKVVVKGLVEDNIRVYSDFSYTALKDIDVGNYITLKIPNKLKDYIKSGEILKVEGTPVLKINPKYSKAELILVVSNIADIESSDYKRPLELEALKIKNKNGFKNIDEILLKLLMEGKEPNIAIVLGNTAIVDRDILAALGDAVDYYNLEIFRTNLSNPEEIIQLLKKLDTKNYDLIVLVRGGGEGIDTVFNNEKLLMSVANMKTPLAVAIGHAKNKPLIELIADKSFITPTDLGNFLKELVKKVNNYKIHEKLITEYEKKIEKLEREKNENYKKLKEIRGKLRNTQSLLDKLENQNAKLKLYIIIALLLGLLIGIFLQGRFF